MIPNIEKAIEDKDINNSRDLGYISHLLLDKYFLEEYAIKYDFDIFYNKKIYDDYDIINNIIIKHFNLDVNYLEKTLTNFSSDVDLKLLEKNICCLNKIKKGKTKIIEIESFIVFLDKTIDKIKKDLIMIMR